MKDLKSYIVEVPNWNVEMKGQVIELDRQLYEDWKAQSERVNELLRSACRWTTGSNKGFFIEEPDSMEKLVGDLAEDRLANGEWGWDELQARAKALLEKEGVK